MIAQHNERVDGGGGEERGTGTDTALSTRPGWLQSSNGEGERSSDRVSMISWAQWGFRRLAARLDSLDKGKCNISISTCMSTCSPPAVER